MISSFEKDGYIICENVFSEEEIDTFRNEVLNCLNYLNSNGIFLENSSGQTIPDFINHYKEFFPNIINIKNNEKILGYLEELFNGKNFRFCSHNDIGINRIVGWHKDILNNEYSKYQTINLWETHNNEKHEIVKVLIYLQDHSHDNFALRLVPGSHTEAKLDKNGNNSIYLHPKKGDIVIFDQRITHRGMDRQTNEPRILLAFGFGKNNIFTDQFEEGTVKRQNNFNMKVDFLNKK